MESPLVTAWHLWVLGTHYSGCSNEKHGFGLNTLTSSEIISGIEAFAADAAAYPMKF